MLAVDGHNTMSLRLWIWSLGPEEVPAGASTHVGLRRVSPEPHVHASLYSTGPREISYAVAHKQCVGIGEVLIFLKSSMESH